MSGYNVEFVQNPRRGRLAVVHPSVASAPAIVKKAREGSLQVKGSKLFNLIPLELRGMTGTVDQFKFGLDKWLSIVQHTRPTNSC